MHVDLYDFNDDLLPVLHGVRSLRLVTIGVSGPDPIDAPFCRIFSAMMPNLQELELVECDDLVDIQPHLRWFHNLEELRELTL